MGFVYKCSHNLLTSMHVQRILFLNHMIHTYKYLKTKKYNLTDLYRVGCLVVSLWLVHIFVQKNIKEIFREIDLFLCIIFHKNFVKIISKSKHCWDFVCLCFACYISTILLLLLLLIYILYMRQIIPTSITTYTTNTL